MLALGLVDACEVWQAAIKHHKAARSLFKTLLTAHESVGEACFSSAIGAECVQLGWLIQVAKLWNAVCQRGMSQRPYFEVFALQAVGTPQASVHICCYANSLLWTRAVRRRPS